MDATASRSLPHTIHHLRTMRKKHSWFRSVGKAFMSSSCSFSSRDAYEKEEEPECCPQGIIVPPEAPTVPNVAKQQELSPDVSNGTGGVSPSSVGVDDRSQAIAAATAKAAEAAVAAAQAVAEVVRIAGYRMMSREESAAVVIQSFYRGYLARRALRALRGLVKLQAMVRGQYVRKQAHTTLRCMQTLVRVQAQARARRRLLADEKLRAGGVTPKPPQNGRTRDIYDRNYYHHGYETEDGDGEVYKSSLRCKESDGWDGGRRSLQMIRAESQRRHDAAVRRERALAYALSCQRQQQQLKQQSQGNNRQLWGWNWLERWMATQTWQSRNMSNDRQTEERTESYATLTSTDDLPLEMDIARVVRMDDVKNWRAECTTTRAPSYMAATESAKAKYRADVHRRHCVGAGRWSPSTVASPGTVVGFDSSSSGGASSAYKSLLRSPVPSIGGISSFRMPAAMSTGDSPEHSASNDRTPSFATRLWNNHA